MAGSVEGYEIHSGIVRQNDCAPLYSFPGGTDGAIHPHKLIFGTFIHDVFRNTKFTRAFVNHLRSIKGLSQLNGPVPEHRVGADSAYERLARIIEENTTF